MTRDVSRSLRDRFRAALAEHGPAGLVLVAVDRVLRASSGGHWRLYAYALMAQPLAAPDGAPGRARSGTRIDLVGPDDPIAAQIPRPAQVLQQRWANGTTCTAAVVKGELAGMLWIARDEYAEDEVRCLFRLADPARSVWDFDVYVAPRLRGGPTLARLWQSTIRRLTDEGVQWSFSRIALDHPASLAAHRRLGARKIGNGLFCVLGSWQISLLTLAPYLHVSFGPKQMPIVRCVPPRPRSWPMPPIATPPPTPKPPTRPSGPDAPKRAALVLGLDSHGLAVARALADAGVDVVAMRKSPPLPGAYTNRVKQSFPVDRPEFERFGVGMVSRLVEVRQALSGYDEVALLAINDRHVEQIGRHIDELRPHFRITWAGSADTVLRLQRKSELEAHSRLQGLNYPRSVLFTQADAAGLARDFSFPVIIKPVRPLSSFKTLIAHDLDELDALLRRQTPDLPILGQEYVAGNDECLYFGALMLDQGRVLHGMVGRKLASHPPARGQTTIAETVDEPEVLRLTERFFDGLGLSGPVSLELKRGPDGRFWVIEPTVGRTDFWAGLCIGAGFNQPLMEFQIACGLAVSTPGPTRKCVWYDTERDPAAWLRLCWDQRTLRPRGGNQVFPYIGHRDVRPWLRAVIGGLGNLMRRRIQRLSKAPVTRSSTPRTEP